MGDERLVPPPVLWAQRRNLLYVKVQLEDCRNPTIKLEKDKIYYKGRGGTDNKDHEVTLEFLKDIKPEDSKFAVKDRATEFVLIKAEEGFWKRLLKEDKKFHWLKVDFNKWKDEDDSEEEAEGTDFEEMMRKMGGMNESTDLNYEAEPDSDDEGSSKLSTKRMKITGSESSIYRKESNVSDKVEVQSCGQLSIASDSSLRDINEVLKFVGSVVDKRKGDLFNQFLSFLNEKKMLDFLNRNKINRPLSSILHGAKVDAEAFKELNDLSFDQQGNKAPFFKTLEAERRNELGELIQKREEFVEQSRASMPKSSNVVSSGVFANIPLSQNLEANLVSSNGSGKGTSNKLSTIDIATSEQSGDAKLACSLSYPDLQKINSTVTVNKGEKGSKSLLKGPYTGGFAMRKANFQLMRRNKENREFAKLHRASRQTLFNPPSFRELTDANRLMYVKKALDDIVLNYNMLSYRDLYKVRLSQWQLNESLGYRGSLEDEDEREFYDLFIDSNCFSIYEDAISKLVNGHILRAQVLLHKLAEKGVAPACYALALVILKELVKPCDVHNDTKNADIMREGEDYIREAIELLEFCTHEMKPASSFLVGMMKAFNVGNCSLFIAGPLQNELFNVVNVARDLKLLELEKFVLQWINPYSRWHTEECGIGMKQKQGNIKKMSKFALYEIVREMLLSENFNCNVVESIFTILTSGNDFPEGLYGYGSILIQDKIGGNFQENVEEAMGLLHRAYLQRHEGAKLLLGVLPLKCEAYCKTHKEVMSCIRILENYMRESDDSCSMNKKNVNSAALCLAAEYCSGKSAFLRCNEEKAKEILGLRNLHEEWDNLRRRSQRDSSPLVKLKNFQT